MFRIVHGSTQGLPDVTAFIETLEKYSDFFSGDGEIFVTRAPGRLDVIGGIADYSGSLVLEMPIREATFAALQKNDSAELEVMSLATDSKKTDRLFEMPLDDFEADGEPISYDAARKYFRGDQRDQWAAYVAGTLLVLSRERGVKFTGGVKILIDSKVPLGKGVSSSAAIEVAAMNAVCAAYDIAIESRELAILCQKVENLVVGAPCGVMDQMSSNCGGADQLMAMVCQPAELQAPKKIPAEIAFWGIDSGIRHSVGAGDYGSVRTGAFMGYRIIADIAGLSVLRDGTAGKVVIEDPKWHGCLANMTPEEFEREFAPHIPEKILGADFLETYDGISDGVTSVEREKEYAVLKPTAHPIYENARVHRFTELLDRPMTVELMTELGELMYGAHESYSACGLGTEGTDLLVSLVKEKPNLYGAKITGGGSGGTVAVLGSADAEDAINEVVEEYEKRMNYRPYVFSGSSPGAADFGYLKLSKDSK
jgi:L-arabinokinase